MGIVRHLGEGYYGVDASNASTKQVSLDRIREMSNHAQSIPDDAIQIRSDRREIGFSYHGSVGGRDEK